MLCWALAGAALRPCSATGLAARRPSAATLRRFIGLSSSVIPHLVVEERRLNADHFVLGVTGLRCLSDNLPDLKFVARKARMTFDKYANRVCLLNMRKGAAFCIEDDVGDGDRNRRQDPVRF